MNITTEQKLAIWEVVNQIRRENGRSELCMADYRYFLGDLQTLALQFDALISDAIAAHRDQNAA